MSASMNPLLCCTTHRIPQSCPSPLLTNFLLALRTIQANSNYFTSPPTTPTSSTTTKPPKTVIELEIITWQGEGSNRDFTHRYFAAVLPILSSWEFVRSGRHEEAECSEEAYRQMYPEECFQEIGVEVVQKRWEGVEEWWKRDESLRTERGERVGWRCRECGWEYFLRVLEFGDLDGDGDGER
jgi:hypothetical protein